MAKGITQDQVSDVADQLLLAGERPTIERIRTALGTGSPNTVNRLLDAWWVSLGERLTNAQSKITLPEAPEEIAALAGQFWEKALFAAMAHATALLEAERQDVAELRAVLAAKRVQYDDQVAQMTSERDTAIGERDAANVRVADLQRLLDLQSAQLSDMATDRDNARLDATTAMEKLIATQNALIAKEASWADTRIAMEASHTAMQHRWLGEVDRARQDESKLATKLKHVEQSADVSARKAGEQIAELTKRVHQTEREEAKKTARITSLESENQRLHEQLKARLQGKSIVAKPPVSKTKKTS